MRARLLACSVAALGILAGMPPGARAAPVVRYYLALGDSLSQGVQPSTGGASLETNQGYPNQLFALESRRIPNLVLVKLGCPGDTTSSMLTPHSPRPPIRRKSRRFMCRLVNVEAEIRAY